MKKLETILGPEEQRIIQVKYQSAQFGKMEWADLETWASVLLVKINTITGWVIPDESLEILVDQFRKKLAESYANCNPDEIEYAFRNYGTAVKDWGKQMNLSLIDEVMIPYLERRLELSRIEEQKAPPIAEIENKEDVSEDAMFEWFLDVMKRVKSGVCTIEFIPGMIYEWLDAKGEIKKTGSEKKEYLVHAVERRHRILSFLLDIDDTPANRKMLSEFASMREKGCFTGEEIDRLKVLAKKIIVYEIIQGHEYVYDISQEAGGIIPE